MKLFVLMVLLFSTSAFSAGLGFQVGGAGVIVGKTNRLDDRTWKGSVGWSINRHRTDLTLTADYIFQDQNFSRLDGEKIVGYAGLGGLIATGIDFGARFPVGVAWLAKKHPIEVFAELSPTVFVVPSSSVGIGLNIGALWFFD